MGGKVDAAHSVGAVPLVVDADLLGHRDRQLVFPMGVLALGGVSQHGVGVVPASHFPHRVEIKALIAGLAAGLGIGQPGYVFQLVSGGLVLIIGGGFRVGVIQVFRVSHGRTEESPRAPIPIPNRARLEVFYLYGAHVVAVLRPALGGQAPYIGGVVQRQVAAVETVAQVSLPARQAARHGAAMKGAFVHFRDIGGVHTILHGYVPQTGGNPAHVGGVAPLKELSVILAIGDGAAH